MKSKIKLGVLSAIILLTTACNEEEIKIQHEVKAVCPQIQIPDQVEYKLKNVDIQKISNEELIKTANLDLLACVSNNKKLIEMIKAYNESAEQKSWR